MHGRKGYGYNKCTKRKDDSTNTIYQHCRSDGTDKTDEAWRVKG